MPALDKTERVAVIGAGAMGTGIAQVAAQAGHSVYLYDTREGAAEESIAGVRRQLEKRVAKGKMSQDDVEGIVSRMKPAKSLAELSESRLVIEAIVENLDVKRQVFSELESLCSSDTILTSNTSSLSITSIAASLKRPERVAGMHFFNPAPIMRLVEVITGLATDEGVAETLYATAEKWGKVAVLARSTPGFIVNRVARPFYAESLRLLQEGASTPATLDALLRQAGHFRMGPFELMDLIGHDVNYAVTRSVFDAYFGDTRFEPSLVQKELVEAGRLGRKTGRGFYDYREDAVSALPDFASHLEAELPSLVVGGFLGVAESLVTRAEKAGVEVVRGDSDSGYLKLGGLTLALSDGRCATERAQDEDLKDLVLFDLCFDYGEASAIGLAGNSGLSQASQDLASAFFQRLGFKVAWLGDIPGLIVLRTVAMLVNEAADAVMQGVCNERDCDTATQAGLNYPRGPLAWADTLGLPFVHTTLTNIQRSYGEERYRASFLLRRKAVVNNSFHE